MYLLVALIFIFILFIIGWIIYNQLISARESINEALAGIDVQLKKRFELIPGLVDIVKGYSNYEADTFNKLTSMRSDGDTDLVQ